VFVGQDIGEPGVQHEVRVDSPSNVHRVPFVGRPRASG
jgi:hypothetical protein